jgi:hypothetical protein
MEYAMNVKLTTVIFLLGLAGLAMYSCSDKTTVVPPQPAVIGVSQDTLDYDSTGIQQNLTIYNTGSGTLEWSFGSWPDWLSPSAISGTVYGNSNQLVTLAIDRNLLQPGLNLGNLPLNSNSDSLQIVLLAFKSANPVLGDLSDSLDFGVSLDSLQVTILNTGGDTLHWTAVISPGSSAFSVTPAAGATLGQCTIWVRFNRDTLSTGLQQATLQINSDGGSAQISLQGYAGTAGGAWLTYTPVSSGYYIPDPLDLYFIVRFDRPTGWQNFKISALRVNLYSQSYVYDDIEFFCWGVFQSQGYLFPDLANEFHDTGLLDPYSGWNEWVVNWPLSLSTFTVGYYQWDYNYPAYPAPWYDNTTVAGRSYRIFQDQYGYVYGDLLGDRDWCIEIFVEPISTVAGVTPEAQGRWLASSKIQVEPSPPHEVPPYQARIKLK